MDFSIFEGGFLLFLQNVVRCPALDAFLTFITKFGNAGWLWILIGILLLISKKYRREGFSILLALLIGFVITNLLLKNLIARPRPYTLIEDLTILIEEPSDYSFPSGHTCSSIAASITIWKTCGRKWGILAVILAILIAFSRLYIGVHYPTDVLGGAVIGVIAAVISATIYKRFLLKDSKN